MLVERSVTWSLFVVRRAARKLAHFLADEDYFGLQNSGDAEVILVVAICVRVLTLSFYTLY